MKKIFLSFCSLVITSLAIAQSVYDSGVVINGVKWATRNVGAPGTFASSPEKAGMLYQWNRKIGWTATYPRKASNGRNKWNKKAAIGSTWEKYNDPSPAGWRVPTIDELLTLCDPYNVSYEWTVLNGVKGMIFIDINTGNSIFFPAAGSRDRTGTLAYTSMTGYYWSSTPSSKFNNEAYYIYVYAGGPACEIRTLQCVGHCVRSVAK